MNAIQVNKDHKAQFSKLFIGLGTLDRPDHVIKLKPDTKPFALITPRRLSVPLLAKVKEEISWMEISKVDELTELGKVRICVDLTRLNESILREFQPLPCVNQIHAQLAGAKVFRKLDANSGF